MASKCISNCVNDARAPVRATYINLYKWPESDVEFIRSVRSKMQGKNNKNGHGHHPKVVDSISCRQLYLRSYTFSREEENVNDEKKAVKCYGKRKRKLPRQNGGGDGDGGSGSSSGGQRQTRRKCKSFRKAKEICCSALASIFRRLLSCTTKVDVVR